MPTATPSAIEPVSVPAGALRATLEALRKDYLLWALLALFVLLTASEPSRVLHYPSLVDWPTIAALAGLLTLTKGVELSGYLHRFGERLIERISSERVLALVLVLAAALLSTLITNDVALFVIVPLTLSLRAISEVPVTRLIVFEALAVNAGSALTPIGNPQNLFLWQLSHLPFHQYVIAMLPLALTLLAPLLLLTACAFPGIRIDTRRNAPLPPLRKPLLFLSIGLYLPFLVLVELHQARPALIAVLAIFLVFHRSILARVDWALILAFILMFIDLRLVADLPAARALIAQVGLAEPRRLYLAAIASSQVISNVPAAILLAEYSKDWKLIAYGVNVGGFGFLVGSLANIIALRMAGDRRSWLVFHAYSLPYLAVAGGLVFAWLYVV